MKSVIDHYWDMLSVVAPLYIYIYLFLVGEKLSQSNCEITITVTG